MLFLPIDSAGSESRRSCSLLELLAEGRLRHIVIPPLLGDVALDGWCRLSWRQIEVDEIGDANIGRTD
jgi:hypothetical protein